MEKISVIVPVYNVDGFLKRCLDSILESSFTDLQIICVNDGSTDNSYEILKQYESKDERITVINKENGGLSSARNAGLRKADGEYICFIDSDDWISPYYFQNMYSALQKEKDAQLAICDYIKTDHMMTDDFVSSEIDCEIIQVKQLFRKRAIRNYAWNKLYRREYIGSLLFYEGKAIAEDSLFNLTLYASDPHCRAVYVKQKLYYYFDRPGSLVKKLNYHNSIILCDLLQKVADECDSKEGQFYLKKELLDRWLIIRYRAETDGRSEIMTEAEKQIESYYKQLSKYHLTLKYRAGYLFFAHFPFVFAHYRRRIEKREK